MLDKVSVDQILKEVKYEIYKAYNEYNKTLEKELVESEEFILEKAEIETNVGLINKFTKRRSSAESYCKQLIDEHCYANNPIYIPINTIFTGTSVSDTIDISEPVRQIIQAMLTANAKE